MGDDQTYPIYYVSVSWTQDSEDGKSRKKNGSGWSRMEKTPMRISDIESDVRDRWWPGFLAKRNKDSGQHPQRISNPGDLVIKVGFSREEVWCLYWFSHFTYDTGQTDAEVLDSFQRYVDRIEGWNRRRTFEAGTYPYDTTQHTICFMGAEERWRWHGLANDDPNGEQTEPPCRCKHCKKAGIIRIGH